MATSPLPETYRPRSFTDLGVFDLDGWRLKRVGIAYDGDRPGTELVEAAEGVAHQVLPRPAVTSSRYGLGFLGVHEGSTAGLVFVDWWINENELVHRPFVAPLEDLRGLREARPGELTACVWDLLVICHERQAWVEEMMGNGGGAAAYLGRSFTGVR